MSRGLIDVFLKPLNQTPNKPALELEGSQWSYRSLSFIASAITNALSSEACQSMRVLVWANQHVAAYAGILGTLANGKTYVPLNCNYPVDRNTEIARRSAVDTIIVGCDVESEQITTFLTEYTAPLTVIFLGCDQFYQSLFQKASHHQYVSISANKIPLEESLCEEIDESSGAYLLFTSGSTGAPKGIEVSHSNVKAFVTYMTNHYGIERSDRMSQMHDLTFDFSVHDVFVAWNSGSTLCVVPPAERLLPFKFIREQKISVWSSVPSVISALSKFRLLKPNAFPDIRLSFFCGEPLTETAAKEWTVACPAANVENIYGPTEATVAISGYSISAAQPIKERNGIVAIGQIFPEHRYKLLDENLEEVPTGTPGELCLSGPQVTCRYFDDDEKTRDRYVNLPADNERLYYRTGDLVVQEDGSDDLFFVGRTDHQVKIGGFRVELGEIEHAVTRAASAKQSVCLTWPSEGPAQGVACFLESPTTSDLVKIREGCAVDLPEYMIPQKIQAVQSWPLNSNGKIDRQALAEKLKDL